MAVKSRSATTTFACVLGVSVCCASAADLPKSGSGANTKRSTTIGLLVPKDETQARSLQEGVSLAVTNANRSSGACVTAVIRGAIGQWGADGVEAARMVTDDEAQGLIAPPGGAGSHLALQVAGRTATPVISLCADSSVTKTGVPWMVRITPSTINEARTLWALLGCKRTEQENRWAVIVPPDRAGREIARDLTAASIQANLGSPTVIVMDSALTNLESICRSAVALGKDGILVWLDPVPAGRLVVGLRSSRYRGALAGPGRLRCSQFIETAGLQAEGFKVAAPLLSPADRVRYERFATDFREAYGREPDFMAAMSYDAAQLLIQAIARAGERPSHAAFPWIGEFPGITGTLNFDSEGNRNGELEIFEVRSGRFVALK